MPMFVSANFVSRYSEKFRITEFANLVVAKQKPNNTIVQLWPNKLKLQPGISGAQEEFDRVMSSGATNKAFYLEWTRADLM